MATIVSQIQRKHQFIPPPLVRWEPSELRRIKNASRSRCKACDRPRDDAIHQIGRERRPFEGATRKPQNPDTMKPTTSGPRGAWSDRSAPVRRTRLRLPSRGSHVVPLGRIENTWQRQAFSRTDVSASLVVADGLRRRQIVASLRTLARAALKIPLLRSRRPAFRLAYDRSFRSWSVRSWNMSHRCFWALRIGR